MVYCEVKLPLPPFAAYERICSSGAAEAAISAQYTIARARAGMPDVFVCAVDALCAVDCRLVDTLQCWLACRVIWKEIKDKVWLPLLQLLLFCSCRSRSWF